MILERGGSGHPLGVSQGQANDLGDEPSNAGTVNTRPGRRGATTKGVRTRLGCSVHWVFSSYILSLERDQDKFVDR